MNLYEVVKDLYSEDESISCKEIAERHGGGGHKGAAGFRSTNLLV